jgi:surface protein
MGTKLRINLSGAGITLPAGTDFTLEFDNGVVQARNPFDPTNNFIIKQYTSENLPTLHNLASTMSATAGFTGDGNRISEFLSDKSSVSTFTVDASDFVYDLALVSNTSASASIDTAGGDYNYTRALQSSVESTSAVDVSMTTNRSMEGSANAVSTIQTLLDPYANTVEYVFERAGGFNLYEFYPFERLPWFGYTDRASVLELMPITVDYGDGTSGTFSDPDQLLPGNAAQVIKLYQTSNSSITVKFTFTKTPPILPGHGWNTQSGTTWAYLDKATLKSTNFDIRPRTLYRWTFEPYANKFDIDSTDFLPTSVNSLEDAFRYGTGQRHTGARGSLNNTDFNSLNTSRVINFSNCFRDQEQFNRPLSSWDTSKATNMSDMFNGCSSFNQNLNSWDVSNVVDMSRMFRNCLGLNWGNTSVHGTSADVLINWDTGNVQNMSEMFRGIQNNQAEGVSSWDTSSLTNCSSMFRDCQSGFINLSQWDASNITDCSNMFNSAGGLSTVNFLEQWSIASLQNCDGLFRNTSVANIECDKLIIAWKDYVVANSGPSDVSALLMFPSSYSPSTAASTAINTLNTTYNWNITY